MKRRHVVIAGGGVAGLETLLALHAAAGDRVDVTLLAPESGFVNRSMALDQPSAPGAVRRLRLRDITADVGARWHRGALRRVEHDDRVVVTDRGRKLRYDRLVLALGARMERQRRSDNVLTYRAADSAYDYRLLLRRLEQQRVSRLAFVKPAGPSWTLPLYELALATAEACDTVELSLVTPEADPLEVFGAPASAFMRAALEEAGVRLYTGSRAVPSRPGRLHVSPGDRRLLVDHVVTVPRLAGPQLEGAVSDQAGFIRTDAYGRVVGMPDVFAAGDATAFPIKQGGIAAQQADAVAAAIAASVGARVAARPFRPVMRGLVTAGGAAHYMRARDDVGEVSEQPLWWPPNRLCGRYLAPYLSSRVGGSAVMFHAEAVPAMSGRHTLAELADLVTK
jgi:sulfide:quinone oxidoreductase